MSARSFQDLDRTPMASTETSSEQSAPWSSQLQPRGNAFAQEQMRSHAAADAEGIVPGSLRMAISACFGDAAEGIEVTAADPGVGRDLGAAALTMGEKVMVDPSVDLRSMDPDALEILGHEFAHAMAGASTNPTSVVDRPGDPGERQADDAGVAFRRFVEGGMEGPAPSIPAATGGQALIHRFDTPEHEMAIDGAAPLLAREGLPGGEAVDKDVLNQMLEPVTLENGCVLSPGQVGSLMGDFYGSYDENGVMNVEESFRLLNEAPEEEMNMLLTLSQVERAMPIPPEVWDLVTIRRHTEDQQSYLDLAQQNENHFSGSDMEGLDDNMGTYATFHEMALEAAEAGDMNRARTLEACSMHYLTDRHAAGHQFDQSELMENTGINPDNPYQLLRVKNDHDILNREGLQVHNAEGESWTAYGDDDFYAPENEENVHRIAESIYTSYAELTSVGAHEQTAAEIADTGFGAFQTVPQWSDQTQAWAERTVIENPNSPLQYLDDPEEQASAVTILGMKAADLMGVPELIESLSD